MPHRQIYLAIMVNKIICHFQVCDSKLSIKGIKVADVAQTGQFVQVTLLDVPEYVSNSQVEKFMSYYGSVVIIKREYFEYEGRKIENETRYDCKDSTMAYII